MNFYAFNIGDYAGATRHLSWDEDMAYRRMLDAYYSREAPLPIERRQIYRLVAASEPRQREAVDVVLEEFFEERADGWHNNRADEEIAKAAIKKSKAAQSAAARWQNASHSDRTANAPKNHANASRDDANAERPQCEGNAPNPNPNPNPNPKILDDERRTRAHDPELFRKVEKALTGLSELDAHPVSINTVYAPIYQLALEGLDLDTQILPSIKRQALTAKRPIKSWRYFVDGIRNDAIPNQPPANIVTLPATRSPAHGTHRQKPTRDETFAAIDRSIDELERRQALAGTPAGRQGGDGNPDEGAA